MNPNFNPFLNNFIFMQNQNLNNFNQNMPGINYNNFPNPNFMNNQFPMFQNMNNQINNNIINQNQIITNQNVHNFNFKNQHQKQLVDKIIDFYQKNCKKYMNYFEPNQINKLLDNLDINSPNLKEGNDISDPLPYIKEKKKLIKFINHDFKIFNVKVPISIDKMTLYQIAGLLLLFRIYLYLISLFKSYQFTPTQTMIIIHFTLILKSAHQIFRFKKLFFLIKK